MRIVHVSLAFSPCPDLPALLDRHATLTRLAAWQAAQGAEVHVVQRFDRDDRIVRDGVTLHAVGAPGARSVARPLSYPVRVCRLAAALTPDVIHVHGLLFPVQLMLLRAHAGAAPVIVVQDHGGRLGGVARQLAQRIGFRAADGFLFNGAGLAEPYRARGLIRVSAPIFEVPESSSDLLPGDRDHARRRTGMTGAPAILWVGRRIADKRLEVAVDAMVALVARLPDARLYCVFSDARDAARLRGDVAVDPRVASRISLLPRMTHDALADWYAAADLFLTTSVREGSNYSLIEALSCGLPCVWSDIPPHRYLAGPGPFTESCAPDDPAATADAVAHQWQAVHHDPETVRRAVRADFERRLGWAAVAQRTLNVYEDLLARGPTRAWRRRRARLGA